MKRVTTLGLVVAALAAALLVQPVNAERHGAGTARLQLVEATVSQLQRALQTGLITRPVELAYAAGDEYLSISFRPGVFISASAGSRRLTDRLCSPTVG